VPTDQWVDLYTLAGVSHGTQLFVENVGVSDVRLTTQADQPAVTHSTFNVIQRGNGQRLTNTQGDSGVWAFAEGTKGRLTVMVTGTDSGFTRDVSVGNLPLAASDPGRVQVQPGKNDLGYDAWGRPKAITDFSVWYGMFTFEVPSEMWLEFSDGTELTSFANFTSVDGALLCTGTAGEVHTLISKRHPRYQPNRGHLYSTAMYLDTYNNGSTYEFGLFSDTSGVFFRVKSDGKLYGVRRTLVSGVVTEAETLLDTTGIDLAKGNVFDIQFQWRGVGDYRLFINLQDVGGFSNLGTLDALSVYNPALPVTFQITGAGTMRCGCVDVTSEGGSKQTRIRGFIGSPETALSATELPVIAWQMPRELSYNGTDVLNTRDVALRRITAFADDATLMRIYYTRTASKFTGTTWTDYDSIGTVQYAVNGDITVDTLASGFIEISARRISANSSIEIENPDPEYGDYYLVGGDIILVTLEAKNSTTGGAGIEWGSEI